MSLPAPFVDDEDDEDLAYAAHVRLATALRRVQEANALVAVSSMTTEDIDALVADVESVAARPHRAWWGRPPRLQAHSAG